MFIEEHGWEAHSVVRAGNDACIQTEKVGVGRAHLCLVDGKKPRTVQSRENRGHVRTHPTVPHAQAALHQNGLSMSLINKHAHANAQFQDCLL